MTRTTNDLRVMCADAATVAALLAGMLAQFAAHPVGSLGAARTRIATLNAVLDDIEAGRARR